MSSTLRFWTVAPNLLCVAGAFTLGFTSLHSVVITNLGVMTVYRSGLQWWRIRRGDDPDLRAWRDTEDLFAKVALDSFVSTNDSNNDNNRRVS